MSRTAGVALAVVAVLAGLAIGAIPASSQPGQRTQIVALDLDKDDRFMEVDNNRKGFSAGDQFGFTSPLLDPDDRSKIGAMKALCTALHVSRENNAATQLCEAEAVFPEGRLTATGSLKFGGNNEGGNFTLTGGTEAYEGAMGTVTVEFRRKGATVTFDFATSN